MFEKATRQQLRFNSKKGLLSVEDLWTLPLKASGTSVDLDEVAKIVHKELKDSEEVSFVAPVTSSNTAAQLKMDIVKHIISVKLAEQAAAQKARETKEKKQMIMQIIAQKQNDALANSSVEDLQKMLDNL
jgi:hypothetical protein